MVNLYFGEDLNPVAWNESHVSKNFSVSFSLDVKLLQSAKTYITHTPVFSFPGYFLLADNVHKMS